MAVSSKDFADDKKQFLSSNEFENMKNLKNRVNYLEDALRRRETIIQN